jgi:ankyrin repeat protein
VRRTLEELPGDLDATYERILEKIPSVNRVYTHRLLQCLTVAARPLEVEELAEVLAIEFDVIGGIPKLTEDFRWENQEQAVLSACSSLVIIVNYRGSRRVQFSHFSVLEFLSSDRLANSDSSALSYYYIQRESAHTVMAQACLGALLRLGDHMDKGTIESYPLADYAGEFFAAHAKAGEVLSKINNGVDNLLDPDKPHLNTWLWLQSFDWDSQYFDLNPDSISDFGEQHSDQSNSEYPIYPPRVSPLYYTLLFGHTCLAKYIIRNRPRDLGATDMYGRTALHIAAFKSDFDVVQMLVDIAHIAVNSRDKKDCTPLHYAMHDGDQESHDDVSLCAERLLERGADVEAQNNRGSTPLHLAASKTSEKSVRLLIKNGAMINLQNNKSQTALHKASRHGHLDIVRLLLDHKADIDLQDNHGSTPLHLAIYHMSREAVQLFLDRGADVTLQNGKGQAALHRALQRGHPDIIQLILSGENVDADALDNDGSTPLHLAASEAEVLSGARLLLMHGANINLRNKKGQTPLHLASQRGHIDCMELLLNCGAIVDLPDNDGFTPLHLAISKVERRAAELLLKSRANINLRNDKGQTAFHQASERGDLLFMEVALTYGADVNARDNDDLTPLDLVISKLDESAQLLIKHGAIINLNPQNERGQTLLHLASQIGHIVRMRLLLKCGADMDAFDNSGSTPLHLAISESKLPAAEVLLKHGANTDLQNNKHQTALHLAWQHGQLDIIRLLLENGANLDALDDDGSTLLHLAISESKPPAAELLLKHGAKIDLQNNKRQTALHLALQHGHLEIIRLLLENGANLDALDDDGSTLLHLASSRSELPVAELLLKHGANVDLQNNKRQTALHLALQRGHLEVIRLLLENGANVDALDSDGSTPLDLGIFSDANSWRVEQAVGLLLERGANINLRNPEGQTILHKASRRGDIDTIYRISKHGPDVNALDNNGSTPLDLAISDANSWRVEEVVRLLLEHGADTNLRNGQGQTALHKASLRGYPSIIYLIVYHGADVDAQDNDGSTPLHLMISKVSMDSEASNGSEASEDSEYSEEYKVFVDFETLRKVIGLLLKHGASVHRENNQGKTPFQVAAERGLEEITGLLSMHIQSERTA